MNEKEVVEEKCINSGGGTQELEERRTVGLEDLIIGVLLFVFVLSNIVV